MFKANTRLQETGGHVWQWMRQNYVAGAAMAVRRELDKDGSVATLRNMLYEMVKRPRILSRRRYIEQWKPKEDWERAMANTGFDGFGIVQSSSDRDDDHIDPAGIEADLAQLHAQTETVRAYIEQTIAHRQRSEPEPVSFEQFNDTIAAIAKVFEKYYALVTQLSIAQLEPVPQYNTTEVFTFPWLSPGTRLEIEK